VPSPNCLYTLTVCNELELESSVVLIEVEFMLPGNRPEDCNVMVDLIVAILLCFFKGQRLRICPLELFIISVFEFLGRNRIYVE
jgi:hypothetical protein